MEVKIVIFDLYIPPSDPSSHAIWNKAKTSAVKYLASMPTVLLLIMGDFNTRLGPNNSSLAHFMNWDLDELIPHWFQGSRSSKDSVINSYAPYFIDMCLELNLVILNGSTGRDILGKFTHFVPRGASVRLRSCLSGSPSASPRFLC